LKYSTKLSINPTKHSAQQAKHASTAADSQSNDPLLGRECEDQLTMAVHVRIVPGNIENNAYEFQDSYYQ
jgi:hypothetical protein